MYQNRYAPRLARLHRACGGRPAFTVGQSNLRAALTDDRARLCGRERKTRHALYTLSRAARGYRMGQAQICRDESQETCHPQVAVFLPLPVFLMLESPLLYCNGDSLTDCGAVLIRTAPCFPFPDSFSPRCYQPKGSIKEQKSCKQKQKRFAVFQGANAEKAGRSASKSDNQTAK